MKAFASFLVIAASASAQIAPRMQLSGEFTGIAQASAARSIITNKLASVNVGARHSLDESFRVSTNFGMVTVSSVEFFASSNIQAAAIHWFTTNQFGGNGWRLAIYSHKCPGTNATPDGWLGCAMDPRAEASTTVITP